MAVGAKFDVAQAEEVKKLLKAGFDKAARRAALSAGIRLVGHVQTTVIPGEPRPPVDRGVYRGAWHARPAPHGADVVNTTSYAPVIELGARAEHIKIGRKMIDALAEWAKRKGLDGKGKDPRSVAWAIAKSMARRGIYNGGKGLRILEKAMRLAPKFLGEELAREMKREMG